MDTTTIKEEFKSLFNDAIVDAGSSLNTTSEELAAFAAERTNHLANIVGDPGFEEALRAETDNVFIQASIIIVERADALDAKIQGLIAATLRIGAKALVAAA